MTYENRHAVVVGLGNSGLAAARYLSAHGARVSVADDQPSAEHIAKLLTFVPKAELRNGHFTTRTFADANFLLISPGVPLKNTAIDAFRKAGGEVIGDIEVLARAIRSDGSKVIAITGSNGKSTVTSLTGHLCAFAGLDTVVAGNIGLSVLQAQLEREQSKKRPDVWVLELSSFQLESTYSLSADAATVLNIFEDHLDRYDDLLSYAYTKARVFQGVGTQVLNHDDVLSHTMVRPGRNIKWFSVTQNVEYALEQHDNRYWLSLDDTRTFDCSEMKLKGQHNAANALAALALCEAIGVPRATLLQGLKSFQGLRHRLELVDEIGSVEFIDDSKGTNVGATVTALNSMNRPIILIAGGDGKGQDFSPLSPACRRIVRAVLLIGRDADKIRSALSDANVPLYDCANLHEAIHCAAELAERGDVVLLSPACSSLDMFQDYKHRAQVFIETVRELKTQSTKATPS